MLLPEAQNHVPTLAECIQRKNSATEQKSCTYTAPFSKSQRIELENGHHEKAARSSKWSFSRNGAQLIENSASAFLFLFLRREKGKEIKEYIQRKNSATEQESCAYPAPLVKAIG